MQANVKTQIKFKILGDRMRFIVQGVEKQKLRSWINTISFIELHKKHN